MVNAVLLLLLTNVLCMFQAAIGAPFLEPFNDGLQCGGVYIYTRPTISSGFSFVTTIIPENRTMETFGASLVLNENGTVLVAGREGKFTFDNTTMPSVYHKDKGGASNWGLVARLGSPIDQTRCDVLDDLPVPLAMSGDYIVVGCPTRGLLSDRGVVYVYGRNVGGIDMWGLEELIWSPNPGLPGKFGASIALHNWTMVVGQTSPPRRVHVYRKLSTSALFSQSVVVIAASGDWCAKIGRAHV